MPHASSRSLLLLFFWIGCFQLNLTFPANDAIRIDPAQLPPHPRLHFTPQRISKVKKLIREDAYFKGCYQRLVKLAQKEADATVVTYRIPDGKRLLATSRKVLKRMKWWGMMWLFSGERKWAERAWREFEAVEKFPDWNPKHFLDTAEMAHAIGICYDWFYPAWNPDQRKRITAALHKFAFVPALNAYQGKARYGWWRNAHHNWNQVCNGGLVMAVLAIAETDPKLARTILQYALRSLPKAIAQYEPDGAWPEGPGYWAYATVYFTGMLDALQNTLGSRFGLDQGKGFQHTAEYALHMLDPSGFRRFNFEDCGERAYGEPLCLWFAREYNNPLIARVTTQDKKRFFVQALLYLDEPIRSGAGSLPLARYFRGVEVVAMRESWTDPNATYFAILAGNNRVNHNHLDCGSFVLDAGGIRWFCDLGGDNYNLPQYFGGKRYTYYRTRAEGHNTLVINPGSGPDQNRKAQCKVTTFRQTEQLVNASIDLTPAYLPHARRIVRSVEFKRGHHTQITLSDDIALQKPGIIEWFAHTRADIKLTESGHQAMLTQSGKQFMVRILSPANAVFTIHPAAPLPTSPNPPGQNRNDKVRKLRIHFKNTQNLKLRILFSPVQ